MTYYYIGKEKKIQYHGHPIDQKLVIRMRPVIATYRQVPLHKQFFKLMEWARDNGLILPKGSIIAALRENLDTNPIRVEEDHHFRLAVCEFRKWLGAIAGMVVYAYKGRVGKTLQQLYRPLRNKKEYMEIAGNHIANVINGATARHTQNLEILRKSQKQIDKIIEEYSSQIDVEVGIPSKKRRNKH
jgi:hypothetical protein